MVITNRGKATVWWIPVTPLLVSVIFMAMAGLIQWGISRLPDGIPAGTQRSIWLMVILALIFCGRALWGMRWFRLKGQTLIGRSVFRYYKFQPDNCVVAYRAGTSLPGTSSSFLILIEFITSPQSGKKIPRQTFLCGWVLGLTQARTYAQQLQKVLGVNLGPQLSDTSPAPVTDTIKKAIIIIPLAVIIILLVNLFILYIRK
jgi:hypothetical protein